MRGNFLVVVVMVVQKRSASVVQDFDAKSLQPHFTAGEKSSAGDGSTQAHRHTHTHTVQPRQRGNW